MNDIDLYLESDGIKWQLELAVNSLIAMGRKFQKNHIEEGAIFDGKYVLDEALTCGAISAKNYEAMLPAVINYDTDYEIKFNYGEEPK